MPGEPVFFDPHGLRRKRTRAALLALGMSIVVLALLFWSTLVRSPNLPRLKGFTQPDEHKPFLVRTMDATARKRAFEASRSRNALLEAIRNESLRTPPKSAPGSKIVAAFYATYDEIGLHSLEANGSKLTHIIPEWLHLDAKGNLDDRDFDYRNEPKNREVVRVARENHLKVVPLLNNAENGAFHPDRVSAILADPARQQRLAEQLTSWLSERGFDGLNLDFENLPYSDYRRLPALLRRLRDAFARKGLLLSVDLELDKELPLSEYAKWCDFMVLMAYDEHSAEDDPGPIASADWVQGQIDRAKSQVDPRKLVMGFGGYGYDWPRGSRSPAQSLSYQEAMVLAASEEGAPSDIVDFDSKSLNPHFDYADDAGRRHSVWFLDGVTAYNQWRIVETEGLAGAALWVLGQEDPSIWSFFDRSQAKADARQLETVDYPFEVDRTKERGEILRVVSTPNEGRRKVGIDQDTGLIDSSQYLAFPSSYVLGASGFSPKKLALTFDDGPDGTYTAEILDTLRDLKVPATFFIIGANAEARPDLVRRMVDEGHEVGSHTFFHPNMGKVGDERARLELNATQRSIESITGRSTVLFRPPFNADSEPDNPEQLAPVVLAASMGYVTVGEKIDPNDWRMEEELPDGTVERRNADDLVRELRTQVSAGIGNVILLHDGGGDRSATVEALRRIVPELRKQGYEFVPVSTLMGLDRDRVMPALAGGERSMAGLDRLVFWLVYASQAALAIGFVLAIGLGLVRVLGMIPLAVLHERQARSKRFDPHYRATTSAVIAAYNEESTIAATIRSVLASSYPIQEVVVVDDGSSDDTSAAVQALGDPRIKLISKPNGGKASALEAAIAASTGEVLFSVDADTQLDPDAVGRLVRHFENPAIGAVAGNVKVGNRVNLLTNWQSIEYITSQNMDRRAYAQLDAVTVVPGAIGAWRRAAVLEAGGYSSDTLAEDMDLTWRIHAAGYEIETESGAIAYTEAPDALGPFFRQRFRWTFGTLQCLWKHRRMLGRFGWFGRLALPALWLFQILFQALAPLVDLQLIFSLGVFGLAAIRGDQFTKDWQPQAVAADNLVQIAALYVLFFGVELVSGIIAFRMDRERMRGLWGLFFQRFVYRQIMYGVLYKAFATAVRGFRQGWGKLERKASVSLPKEPS